MELRDARPEDAEEVAAVVVAARLGAFEDLVGGRALAELDPEDELRAWEGRLARGDGAEVVVAVQGDRVVGVVAWAADGAGVALEDLWVHPAAQGAGVGALLLERTQERLPGRRARTVLHAGNWWTARLLESRGWAREPDAPGVAAPDEGWARSL